MGMAVRVPPANLDGSFGDYIVSLVYIRGAFSGTAGDPAVDLGHPAYARPATRMATAAADGRPARILRDRMTDARLDERGLSLFQGEQQAQPHEVAGLWALIVVEVRRLPLTRDGEIEPAVAIDVGQGDASREHRLGHRLAVL